MKRIHRQPPSAWADGWLYLGTRADHYNFSKSFIGAIKPFIAPGGRGTVAHSDLTELFRGGRRQCPKNFSTVLHSASGKIWKADAETTKIWYE
jgi:hypothetical protein